MSHRTRHELIGLFGLILSTRLKPAPSYPSREALAAACGVEVELVDEVEATGLLRSEPSRPGRSYDADDARVLAIVAELRDLGITDADIRAHGDLMIQRCGQCEADPCPTRCDAIDVMGKILRGLAERPGAGLAQGVRIARIERAITSISALSDLI